MSDFEMQSALKHLKQCRGELTRQQIRTLKGQILAGDPAGAISGLQTILGRNRKRRKEGTG